MESRIDWSNQLTYMTVYVHIIVTKAYNKISKYGCLTAHKNAGPGSRPLPSKFDATMGDARPRHVAGLWFGARQKLISGVCIQCLGEFRVLE